MALPLSFRKADPTEAPLLAELLLKVGLSKNPSEATMFVERELLFGDYYYIAETIIENKTIPVGLISIRFHGMPRHGCIELMHIGVDDTYRGHGIGTQLIEYMEKILPEEFENWNTRLRKKAEVLGDTSELHFGTLRKIFLLTGSNSLPAHKLYEKCGYTRETALIHHLHADQDQVVYSKFF